MENISISISLPFSTLILIYKIEIIIIKLYFHIKSSSRKVVKVAKISVDQTISKAKSHTKKGELHEAKMMYQKILQAFPKNRRALKGLAALKIPKRTAISHCPPQVTIDRLLKLHNKGSFFDLVKQATMLIKKFPKSHMLWNILGAANRGLGHLEESSQAFKKVTELKPNYADGYNNLGVSLQEQYKLDEALASYYIALSIKPEYVEAHNNIGNLLKEQCKIDEALTAYNMALSIKPDYAEAYYNKGVIYQVQDKLEQAMSAFSKALSIKPDYAKAKNNLDFVAKQYTNSGKTSHQYKKAVSLELKQATALIEKGNTLRKQNMLNDAIKAYDQAILIKPDFAKAYIYLGIIFHAQGKLQEAINANNKVLSILPNNAGAFNNIGTILKEQGKLEEAIVAFKKSLALDPKIAETHNNIANTLKDLGKVEEAIVSFNRVLAINPDHAEAKHLLSSLTGEKNSSAPREYVENLFDGYAENFDQSLLENLNYDIPRIITELAVKEHGSGSLGSILDLGCGTGLTGVKIKEFCSNLEGVDLSNEMLNQARKTDVYDRLDHVDIVEYLSSFDLDFDYFISTDVFIYVGELSEIFRLIKIRNKKPGKLIFSTEHTEMDGFHIETSARYSHSKSYIEGLCKKFNYSITHFSKTNLRKERGVFLTGGLYILDF